MANPVAAYFLAFTTAAGGGNPPPAPELETKVESAIVQSLNTKVDAQVEATSTPAKPVLGLTGLTKAFSNIDIEKMSAAIATETGCTKTGVTPGQMGKQVLPNGMTTFGMSAPTITFSCSKK